MTYPFPSQAWADAFRAEIEQSTLYARLAQRWEGDVILAIEEGGGSISISGMVLAGKQLT